MKSSSAHRPKKQNLQDLDGLNFSARIADTSGAKKRRASVGEAATDSQRGGYAQPPSVVGKEEIPPDSEFSAAHHIECKESPTAAPSGSLLPHEPAISWAITEFTGYQSTRKIRYLSSWRTPVLLEKPCRTEKLDGPVEEYGGISPTSSVRSVASKVDTAVAKEGVLARGLGKSDFTDDEWGFVLRNTGMLGLYKESNSRYIYPVCMRGKRRAMQILMDAIRLTNGGNPITKESIEEKNPESWEEVKILLEALIDPNRIKGDP